MELAEGTRLGPYEVIAAVGAGGMGEVYRARDTRLDRSVAIKILPSHLSRTPELKSRFDREARTLSSLSHPHICPLYDVGSAAGVDFLVMELLEGETLEQRLRKGPMPLPELLKTGMEIADALEKAHRAGVVHRDLKPSNVMLTKNGAKLMDFGLAKPDAMKVGAGATQASLAVGATATFVKPSSPISSVGTIVGTINYMAPEQIEGKEAEARSDLFALGAVLYEMATGQRAFEGKSSLSVASAILDKEPPPLTTVHPASSPALDYVIRACLAKDPEERFQTAHDVKLYLNWLQQPGSAAEQPVQAGSRWRTIALGLAAAAVLLLALLLTRLTRHGPPVVASAITRFSIALPPRQELAVDNTQTLALAPDGRHLAYVAADSGVSHLYVRSLDRFDSLPIPDSEGATFPFFSPDGKWVAFFGQGKLKKATVDGSNPVVICELPTFFGGTWTPQDKIVVAVPSYGLASVSANGGALRKVLLQHAEQLYPQGPAWMPGGDWLTFTDYFASARRVMLAKLSSGEVRPLVNNAQAASYVDGHLVYYSGGALWAVRFDPQKLAIEGDAVEIESGINEENYIAQASASSNGVLAYAPGPAGNFARRIYLVNRQGVEQKLDLPAEDYVDPAFSPDGKRVAMAIRAVNGQQLAVYDRERGLLTYIVSNGALNDAPVWIADGKSLLFDSVGPSQKRGIYRVAADGTSAPQLVRETSVNSHVTAAAGDYAAVTVNDPVTSTDLWLLKLRDHNEMLVFKRTEATERQGSLSPDGRWLAYASNESGRSEIYVEPVPGPGGRWQISNDGGEQPRWVRNGREILYRNGTRMMSVSVRVQPVFRADKASQLFDRRFDRGGSVAGYDVTPDGQTFVMTRSEHASPTEVRVVIGWAHNR